MMWINLLYALHTWWTTQVEDFLVGQTENWLLISKSIWTKNVYVHRTNFSAFFEQYNDYTTARKKKQLTYFQVCFLGT